MDKTKTVCRVSQTDRALFEDPETSTQPHLTPSLLSAIAGCTGINFEWPRGLMDKVLVFGTKDCRLEYCQGHVAPLGCHCNFLSAAARCAGKLMVMDTEQKTPQKEKEEEVMSLPKFAPTSLYTILGFPNPPKFGFLKYTQKWSESVFRMCKFLLRNAIPL